jgi:hypothetical protein
MLLAFVRSYQIYFSAPNILKLSIYAGSGQVMIRSEENKKYFVSL